MTDEMPKRRSLNRRRRANVPGGRTVRHDVWVSAEEEGALLLRSNAQGVTVARLLVESALTDVAGETATERRAQVAELFKVHRQLAGVANNLNQIARTNNAEGLLPFELRGSLTDLMAQIRMLAGRIDVAIDELGAGR